MRLFSDLEAVRDALNPPGQGKVADQLKIPTGSLSSFLKGVQKLKEAHLLSLSEFLKSSPEHLMDLWRTRQREMAADVVAVKEDNAVRGELNFASGGVGLTHDYKSTVEFLVRDFVEKDFSELIVAASSSGRFAVARILLDFAEKRWPTSETKK